MRRVLTLLLAFVAAAPALASVTSSHRKVSCKMWEHRDMQGAFIAVPNGSGVSFANPSVGSTAWSYHDEWNDDVSSARVPPRCALTVYEHIEAGGQSKTWRGGQNGLRVNYVGDRWNDEISSARCNCDP